MTPRAWGFFLAFLCSVPAHGAEESESTGRELPPASDEDDATLLEVVDPLYERGISAGWADLGWAPRLVSASSAQMDLADKAGWILAKRGAVGVYGGLVFQLKAPESFGDFLEVRLDAGRPTVFPRVKVDAAHRTAMGEGWVRVFVTMDELNPKAIPFDRVVFQAGKSVGHDPVEFDHVGMTRALGLPAKKPRVTAVPTLPARSVRLLVDCRRRVGSISPLIYGIAQSARTIDPAESSTAWSELRPTARRWSGPESTRYDWKIHAANAGASDYFRNFPLGSVGVPAWKTFLRQNREAGLVSAMTVPLLGQVAKDDHSYAFPVSVAGPQVKTAPDEADVGNGIGRDGPLPSPPPSQTSVTSTPQTVAEWVSAIRAEEKEAGSRFPRVWFLGHEPSLWNQVHRDVHPEPLSDRERLDLTLAYAQTIAELEPNAEIASPAFAGWADLANVPSYLRGIKEAEQKAGGRLLDTLTVHWYAQGKGLAPGREGRVDAQTAALRIRSTRSLWDPAYRDESWIGETVRLIPRLQEWMSVRPGLKLSLGEYGFGAEEHMSGGLALAETLGRLGQANVHSAFHAGVPPRGSATYWAFRAFRNFDGLGSAFESESLVSSTNVPQVSLFASRSAGFVSKTKTKAESAPSLLPRVVLVVLNLDPDRSAKAQWQFTGCGDVESRRVFRYSGGSQGLVEVPKESLSSDEELLAPYSIEVVELKLRR